MYVAAPDLLTCVRGPWHRVEAFGAWEPRPAPKEGRLLRGQATITNQGAMSWLHQSAPWKAPTERGRATSLLLPKHPSHESSTINLGTGHPSFKSAESRLAVFIPASLMALAEAPVRLPKGQSPNQTASLVALVAAQVLTFAGVPVPDGRAV